MRFLKRIKGDKRAEGTTGKIVGIAIGLFVASVIVPSALVSMANATLTGVDASVITIFQVLLPILAVIGIAMMFLKDSQ